jgi:uncharacterized protein DUF2380
VHERRRDRPHSNRRSGGSCLSAVLIALLLCFATRTSASTNDGRDAIRAEPRAVPPPVIAVLDFELVGDVGDAALAPQQRKRLQMVSQLLREELVQTCRYRVTDNNVAADLIARLSALEYLHACHGCEFAIAQRLGADQVLTPWVYRVSNLVLALNVEVKDVSTRRMLIKRSLDFRGDNDLAWVRAVKYFVRGLGVPASPCCTLTSARKPIEVEDPRRREGVASSTVVR